VTHTLVLIRHGKSDWSGGLADIDRPLARRGRRQAPEAGHWLAATIALDLAVVSPAARTVATWDLVAAGLRERPEVRYDERVYAASGSQLLAIVRELPEAAATAALVGHNPGLEDLLSQLTGERRPMPTSAIAVVDLEGPWAEVRADATLRTAGRPPPPA
jgi:phosphohistidine phosphatase